MWSTAAPDGAKPISPPSNRWIRLGLVLYLILLTYLLLAPDPFAWLTWLSPPSTKAPAPLPFYLAWLKNDKVHHFTAYGILAGLLLGATQWNAAIVLFATAVHGGS